MPYQLTVDDGGVSLSFILAEGENVVGSGEGCDLVLEHPAISRRHAVVRVGDGGVELEDLGSRNGTTVGEEPIDGPREIEPGTSLAFATLEARIERVDDGDLEAGIAFGPTGAPSIEAQGRAIPTIAMSSISGFTLDHLPGILGRLDREEGLIAVAQATGSALSECLPHREIVVFRHRRGTDETGTVFRSTPKDENDGTEPTSAAGPEATVTADVGEITARAQFLHPSQARSFGPLVTTAAHLVALASRRPSPATQNPARAAEETAKPPDPPSVEPVVQAVYRDATRVAKGDVSVLVSGESGTGKELLARFVHAASPRHGGPFVTLNCAALPRDLLEAELFGVEQGVATGVSPRAGRFELADGGTLFLDEVGDMGAETQARILRVLQEGEVFRLGGQQPRSARVRIVAATNRDIDVLMKEGAFRSDLYHRIADWRVRLPSLRQRPGDIPNLAAWFLEREAERLGIRIAGISKAAVDTLVAYDWPGNIRQLEREMARAALFLEDGQLLQTRHLEERIREGRREIPATLKEKLERVERREIEAALGHHDGNLSAVARDLDVARSTLYRRMEELGIEPG